MKVKTRFNVGDLVYVVDPIDDEVSITINKRKIEMVQINEKGVKYTVEDTMGLYDEKYLASSITEAIRKLKGFMKEK